MKKIDLAYVAGIIDGEGTIGFRKEKLASGNLCYRMRVSVRHTNEWLIRWLCFAFGGSIVKRKASKAVHKDTWQWCIQANQAAKFLRFIYPYLRLKRNQADVALKFQANKRRFFTYRWKPKPTKELAVEEAQAILMRKLNMRGPNKLGSPASNEFVKGRRRDG